MSKNNDKELDLKEKVQKKYPEFTETVDSLPLQALEVNLMRYSKYREETEMAKKKDEALNTAKEKVKVLSGPYTETLGALKLKTAYLNLLIEEGKAYSCSVEVLNG
jgi:hypothetical protein